MWFKIFVRPMVTLGASILLSGYNFVTTMALCLCLVLRLCLAKCSFLINPLYDYTVIRMWCLRTAHVTAVTVCHQFQIHTYEFRARWTRSRRWSFQKRTKQRCCSGVSQQLVPLNKEPLSVSAKSVLRTAATKFFWFRMETTQLKP
jgi:hypothetical protein